MTPTPKPPPLQIDKVKKNPMYLFLVILTIASTIGLQTWITLFNNFAVEVAGLDGDSIGIIQSVREIPGFLALLAVFVLLFIKEHRLSVLSILFLGVGLAITGLFPSFAGLTLTTLVMSFGFHYYETTNMSLTLQYFNENESPWVSGKLRSLAAASSIAVGLLIFLLAPILNFTQLYLIVGGLIVAGAVWGFTQNPTDRNIIPQRKKLIFRRNTGCFTFSISWPGPGDRYLWPFLFC